MIIKVNNIDITSHLLGFKTLSEMNSDSLLIGNAICRKLELKMDNHDGEITSLLDYPFFVYYSGNKLLGKFIVYEKPEKYTGELALTLWDNMYQFNRKYDTQLNYDTGTTINAQLEEMSSLTGVHIDKSNLSQDILNKSVEWYDNTIAMRNYLGWIAELDGCNAFADANGDIVFRDLVAALYETIDIETYDKGEKVTITRICFDDGILKLEEGDSSANTLYLSSNNAYIDSESNLEPILNKYYGLTFYSVKDVKMAGIDNLCLTDLVNYNNEFMFMPLSVEEIYSGGTYSIATVSGEINTVNAEITVNKIDQSVKIRRIKTIVDRNEATMKIISENIDEHDERIAKLELSNEKISLSVESTTKKVEMLEKTVTVTSISSQYGVSTDKTVEPTSWANERPDVTSGQYLWMRDKYIYSDGTIKYDGVRMISAEDGESATVVRIDSSRGTVFKNNTVNTTLSVVVFHGSRMITDIAALRSVYGTGAYLQWSWQRLDEDRFGVISSSDTRIQNDGFSFILTPDDVDTKVTFQCDLIA